MARDAAKPRVVVVANHSWAKSARGKFFCRSTSETSSYDKEENGHILKRFVQYLLRLVEGF